MLARTGDTALQRAARRVSAKIEALAGTDGMLRVAPYGAPLDDPQLGCVSKGMLRDAIREERKLSLIYRDDQERETTRVVWPIAIVYHIHCTMLAAWCELRRNYRHFRTDRIYGCEPLEARFEGEGEALRARWLMEQRWDPDGERREGSVDRALPAR
jgi:predicted DNA-binding transcriptional regulator YafY